jgi:hypothetical protein
MPIYQQILVALLCVLAMLWVAGFSGEFLAWRRGFPSITDTPSMPRETRAPRALAWWECAGWGAFFFVVVLPVFTVSFIIVAPPVFVVSVIAKVQTMQ